MAMTRADAMQLFRHMEWADALVWQVLLETEGAHSAPAVLERLHHVHTVQRIYLQMWQGDAHEVRELATFAGIAELYDWAREYYDRLHRFGSRLDARDLDRSITFPWADELVKWFGEARSATLHETIVQVALHTAHHRGQLNTMLREAGATPPLVDFIGWIWMGTPEPEWASRAAAE